MQHKIIIFLLLLFSFSGRLSSLSPSCYFVHYSTEDGLQQNIIMDMLQDEKGFMWFVTWDGLSRFDGYEFTSYKIYPENSYYMKNNRIDHIYEDKYGCLWLQSYDGEAHRFDPRTETFKGLQNAEGYNSFDFFNSNIKLMPSGKVWLLSERSGFICVKDSLLTTEVYNFDNGRLKGKKALNIFEDSYRNSWLLTDNGICLINTKSEEPTFFFTEQEERSQQYKQSFFYAAELNGEIWFGAGNGRIWIYNLKSKAFHLLETNIPSDIIEIKQISPNKILIVTSQNGFMIYDKKEDQYQLFNRSRLPDLPSDMMVSTQIDNYGNLWIETDSLGIGKFSLQTHQFKYFSVHLDGLNNLIYPPSFFMFEDVKKRLWVHPRGGGFSYYDQKTDNLEPFYNDPKAPDFRFSNIAHSACSDKQGNLWICTRSHGLEKVVFDNNDFKVHTFDPLKQSTVSNDVRAIFEDNDGNCWISTKDGKLRIYDKQWNLLGHLQKDGKVGFSSPMDRTAYCLLQDRKGNIWIGTRGDGLYLAKKQNTPKLSFHLTQYKKNTNDIYSLNDNSVYSIFQDEKGRLWIGTFGGGLNLVENTDSEKIRFINHRNHLKNYPSGAGYRVRFITEDNYNNVCVGTTVGMIMFSSSFTSPENIDFKYYSRIPGNPESLSNNDILYIKISTSGEMYIGTFGGGLNKVTKYDNKGFPISFKSYTKRQGLPSDVCLSIEEDEKGMLWFSTENNIMKLNPQTETFETFGEIKRLMKSSNFSEASSLRTSGNEIIFGSTDGILTFFPGKININSYIPYIAFEGFQLFNKETGIGNNSPLQTNIDDTKQLSLTHKQNFFSIKYAALDYIDPQNIMYAYKLEGFDKDWNYVQKQRIANYTNIPKGKYTFRVKSTNNDGIWADNERQIEIEIQPSFWETPWAYMLYALLFLLLIFICTRILFIIYRLKDKVRVEQQISEMKLRFFTDISHEIRTPLTMITSPIDYLLQDEETSEKVKSQLKSVETNTSRLLRLVNQILDFRKMQHHQLKIELVEIAPFIQEVCKNFEKIAADQQINFQFINQVKDKELWIDKDCVEKIVFNLLSNAFKFTPPGKNISVTISKNNKGVWIYVKDEGKGISFEKQKTLFTRFASFNEDKNKPSTGIGLSMVKDLSDKLKATVSVESSPGKGSLFGVCLQEGLSHFEKGTDIIIEETPSKDKETQNTVQKQEIPEEKTKKQPETTSILVVEDDDDLRHFLKTILEPDYKVYESADGADGFEKAQQIIPDFIISDIMMPKMDGVELLQNLKNNFNTSHIPVVLLTAKTTIQSKLQGLEFGADDYITKPFSVPYFRARVKNLLNQRKHLQEFYLSSLKIPSIEFGPQKPVITSQDENLIDKLILEIENNMNNSEYSVEDLYNSVGMGRTVFFKKIKGLTGLSPIEFIRDIKMKRAAQYLASGEFSVKEISYMVGITDSGYFRKCFKQKYNLSPTEYRAQFNKSSEI